jgi:GNAT superfamily N-acetyltransferase
MYEHLIERGAIRKLWITEAPLYCAHLLRLDPESRRDRFNGTVSDAYIRSYAAPSNFADAVIHGFYVDGVLRGAAELRPLSAREAEAALSVEKDWQSHGVGTALLERILRGAGNRGVKSLHITCLAENRRMRQLARKFHADLKVGSGSVVGKLDVQARLAKAA